MDVSETPPARYAEVVIPLVVFGLTGFAGSRLPFWFGFVLDWAVVLGAMTVLAAWKRQPMGWLLAGAVWVLALVALILSAVGVMGAGLSGPALVLAVAVGTAYLVLVRLPRREAAPVAERHEMHVFHHVIDHTAAGPAWTATVDREPVPAASRPVITGRAVPAIAPPRKVAGSLLAAARSAISERR